MRMAPAFLAVVWWLGAVLLPARAGADWLILNGGKKIETDGPWQLKGDLLTVHQVSGRISTVSVNIVDAEACLRANGGKLHIETLPVPLRAGTSVPNRRVSNSATPNPAIAGSPVITALRAAAVAPAQHAAAPAGTTAGAVTPGTATPRPASPPSAASASSAPSTGAAGPAGSAGSATAAGAPTPAPPPAAPSADEVRARKLAAQAQMRRERRYLAILDSCEHQHVNDQPGFQRCMQAQLAAAPQR
jgi:hypothetical protein